MDTMLGRRTWRAALLASTALLAAPAVRAQTVWTGAVSSDWFTAGNWTPGAVPGAATNVVINSAIPNPTVVGATGAKAATVIVGDGASGRLTIQTVGSLDCGSCRVGFKAGANGTITINGAGSTLVSNNVTVGVSGGGTLHVEAGGAVNSFVTVLGLAAGSNGNATVSGAGSTWTIINALAVGQQGTGKLAIDGAGTLSTGFLTVGSDAGGTGQISISGGGSRLDVGDIARVGASGTGAVRVDSGGVVNSTTLAIVGANTGSNGAITVTGTGSAWNSFSLLIVGQRGTGSLSIDAGGTVGAAGGSVGDIAGSNGAVHVADAGSTWANSGNLAVGGSGNGTLTIDTGGTVTSIGGSISLLAGGTGTVHVSGSGSNWTSTGSLIVGNGGAGSLTIESGGSTTDVDGGIGNQVGSSGTVTVSGASSRWVNTGNLGVGIAGNGVLRIENGGAVTSTLSSMIATLAGSTGAVTVSGVGSTWTSTGGLTIGGAGSGAVRIEAGGVVNTQAGATLGAATTGVGTMTVTGGSSTWNAGFIEIGRSGAAALIVENGGRVNSRSANIGVFFGGSTGAVTVRGAGSAWNVDGDLFISTGGNGTLTIADGGTVRATTTTVASTAGAIGAVNIGAAAGQPAAAAGVLDTPTLAFSNGAGTLVFNHTDSAYAFAPALSGTGAINALAGRTVLTGDSTAFSGTTTVGGGVLSVDGRLGGTLTIVTAGRLEGTGAVGTTTIAGTVAPGHSIGTLTVNGNYTQAAGSTYVAEINTAGQSDRITVTGSALLAGGTVVVSGAAGAPGTRYTLLTAAGGVAGNYAALDATSVPAATPFLRYALAYDPTAVFLDVARSALAFHDAGQTRNQRATGAGLDSLPAGNPVATAVSGLDVAAARAALDQLSGEIHASARSMLIDDGRLLRDAVASRLRRATTAPGPAGVALASRDSARDVAIGRDSGAGNITAWMHGFGAWGHFGGDGNAARVTRSTGGMVIGADAALDDTWRLGLAAGYSHSALQVRARSASARIDNVHVAVYGGGTWDIGGGALGLRFGAAYTLHQVDSKRAVSVAGLTDHVAAHYKARTAQVFGEAGYTLNIGRAVALEPVAALAYVNLDSNRIRETGGVTALSGRGGGDSVLFSTLGVRAAATVAAGTTAITARGMVGWRHAFGDVTPDSRLAFAGGTPFSIAGAPIARNAVLVEAGLDVHVARNVTLGTTYTGQIAKGAQDHGFKATLVWKF